MDRGNTIMFEVCLDELNASILRWISLETRQSNYLFHLASDICDRAKELQEREANATRYPRSTLHWLGKFKTHQPSRDLTKF